MRTVASVAVAGDVLALAGEALSATVTLERQADDFGSSQRVVCLIDSVPAAILAQGQSEKVQVADGAHTLHCQAVSGGFTLPAPVTFSAAGEKRFRVGLTLTKVVLKAE